MENKKLISIEIIILTLSVVFSSVWIGYSLQKTTSLQKSISSSEDSKVLNVSQAAKYLNMTEEEFLGIINIEKVTLEKTGSFSGRMVPYFSVNDKRYFYKNGLDEWLKDVSNNHRQYNTEKGWMLQ